MRMTAAAVTLLLLTGTAHAQGINLWADDGSGKDPATKAKQEEIDRAYREKTQGQPAPSQPAANDPWGGVRASEKPASQSKSQTGSKNR